MTTTYNVSVQDGDYGWRQNFAEADEAMSCTAASLYHGENPNIIRCNDDDITVLAPMDIPASVSLEDALAELDAYYVDEAAINGWARDDETQWVASPLVPIDRADTQKFEREVDEFSRIPLALDLVSLVISLSVMVACSRALVRFGEEAPEQDGEADEEQSGR